MFNDRYLVNYPIEIAQAIQAKEQKFLPEELKAIREWVQYDIARKLIYSEEWIIALCHAYLRIQEKEKEEEAKKKKEEEKLLIKTELPKIKPVFQLIDGGKKE